MSLGGVAYATTRLETCGGWRLSAMTWGHPVLQAARTLRRSPRLALPVLALLALAIGASGAAYSVVYSILLRPLPYRDPGRLAMAWTAARDSPAPYVVSWLQYLEWRRQSRSFQRLAAFNIAEEQLTAGGEPEYVPGAAVTSDFFETLGVPPYAGRFFLPADPAQPEHHVVVLSYRLWRRRFGGSRAVLGRTVILSGSPTSIIGIAPPTFRQPEPLGGPEAQFWEPLVPQPWTKEWTARFLRTVGRLRPGIDDRAAQAEMSVLGRRLAEQHPDDDRPRILVVPLHRQLAGDLRPGLLMLAVAMAALWLVACANVGNQVVAYRLHREHDLQVRAALGAGRRRLAAEAASEALLLGLGGGLLGLVLAIWGSTLLAGAFPVHVAGISGLRFDRASVLLVAALAVASAGLISLPSLIRLAAPWPAMPGLHSPTRFGRRAGALRVILLVAEVAMALPLLAAAALLVRSFVHLRHVPPGFDPAAVTTFRVTLPPGPYPGRQQQLAFYSLLLADLAKTSSIQAAGVAATLPLTGYNDRELDLMTEEKRQPQDEAAHYQVVSPGYFTALRIPLVEGRPFDSSSADGPKVAILSHTLAHRLWPAADPIGRRVSFDYGPEERPRWMTVIGVAGDVHQEGLINPPTSIIYRPLGQDALESMSAVVRSPLPFEALAPRLKAAVWRQDHGLAIAELQPMERLVEAEAATSRFLSTLLAVIAAVTLAITALGILSLMSYIAGQRRHDVAIRVALGARPADIRRFLLTPVLRLLLLGLGAGLLGAVAARRLLAHLLFGVGPADPLTLAGCVLFLLFLGVVAAYLPVRRAVRSNPRIELLDL
jgi:predicted permease